MRSSSSAFLASSIACFSASARMRAASASPRAVSVKSSIWEIEKVARSVSLSRVAAVGGRAGSMVIFHRFITS
ncbi:MAG: hypothetical protein AMS15_04875 [Planctomycetes bacterium DG_23]|nr:MAG: hypothetical protein AMS15_04875 [Planctomycetes bacterium DG_23]